MARSKKSDSVQVINNETEEVREVNIYDLTRDAYINFGGYINNNRSLPRIIDGLKVSYRRLLYSALQYPRGKMVKSANLLGKMMECFPGDTEILDINGNKFTILEIQDKILSGKNVYTFSCDTDGTPKVTKILDVIDKGIVNDLVEVTLDNGDSFRCTPDHKIMLRTGVWMKAKDLMEGSSLMPIYLKEKMCDGTIPRRFVKTNQYDKYARDKWTVVFHLSSNHYDVSIHPETLRDEKDYYVTHHSDLNSLNDYPDNLSKLGSSYHRSLHGSISLGEYNSLNLSNRNKENWKDEEYRGKMSKHIIDSNTSRRVNKGLNNYPLIKIHPSSKVLPNLDKNGMRTFYTLVELMNLAVSDGIKVLNKDSWNNYMSMTSHPTKHSLSGVLGSKYKDMILSFGIDFEVEYTPKVKVNKCPEISKNNYFTKALTVLRSLKLTNTPLTPENFDERFLNIYSKRNLNYRYISVNIPELVSREVFEKIGTTVTYKSNNLSIIESDKLGNHKVSSVKRINIPEGIRVYDLTVDDCSHNFTLGVGIQAHNCHPHSTDGSYGIICAFSKCGIFNMQGFGGIRSIDGTSSPAAAPRYTEVRVSDNYWDILGRLIKKVPYVESPVGPLEPVYIPSILPFSLFCSDSSISGLGLGISTDLPNFSAKSMYQAYIHDDPMLLEPNIDIQLLKDRSELHRLWNEGKGRVVYAYKYSRIKSPDGNPGMLIEGDAGIFVPKLKRIKDWESEGKVYIEDMVTQDGAKLAIFKVPNIKSINIDDIEAEVAKICVNNNTYTLNVSDGNSAFRIPLREWIKATYTNYINLVNQDNLDQIKETEFDIEVYSNIEKVANYIINENPKAENEEISFNTGVRPDVVNAIMSRTISNLRKTKDQTEKVKSLKNKLKELKKFDAVKFTEEIVNRL